MKKRYWLFMIWLLGYLSCVAILFLSLFADRILPDQLWPNFRKLTGIFSPYLTVMVAFLFAHGKSPSRSSAVSFNTAIAASLAFNLTLFCLALIVMLKAGEGLIEQTLDTMESAASLLSFLVGPSIGFYFGSETKSKIPQELAPVDSN